MLVELYSNDESQYHKAIATLDRMEQLNLILYDLYLQIAYSNDVVVNSIIEDNTYQRLTTDSRTLLGSAIRKLITVVVNYLRTVSASDFSPGLWCGCCPTWPSGPTSSTATIGRPPWCPFI